VPGKLSLIVPVKVSVGTAAVQDVSAEVVGLTLTDAVSANFGCAHDSVYVAGSEAAATGLDTTRTAEPEPGTPVGVMFTGLTFSVPFFLKVSVWGGDFVPSDSAQ